MTLEVQYKIKNNPAYLTYLRQNSQWYKYLNRSPLYFKAFEEEAKSKMSLRFSDKLSNTLKTIEILGNVVSSFK